MKKLIIFMVLGLFLTIEVYGFNISFTNLVSTDTTSPHSTLNLPSVIKISTDTYISLYKIQISTNDVIVPYNVDYVTVTITRVAAGFDANIDLLPISQGGIALIKDNNWGTFTVPYDNIWEGVKDGANNEGTIYSVDNGNLTVYPDNWSDAESGGVWTLRLVVDTGLDINTVDKEHAFFIAIKTSNNLRHDTIFNGGIAAQGIEINVGSFGPGATSSNDITADTKRPVIQFSYSPDASNGTTVKIFNTDDDNVYSTSDDPQVGWLNFVLLDEDGNNETDATLRGDTNVFALTDSIELDVSEIIGGLGSGTTEFEEVGGNTFRLRYTIINSTINATSHGYNDPRTFGIRIHDGAGNYSDWDRSFKVYIDSKTPDNITLSNPNVNVYISTISPKLEWDPSSEPHLDFYTLVISSVSDFSAGLNKRELTKNDLKFNLPENGGGNWGAEYSLGALQDGDAYYWSINVMDKADNETSDGAVNRRFSFDSQVPSLTWISPSTTVPTVINNARPSISAYIGDFGLSGVSTSSIKMQINDGTNDIDVTITSMSYDSGTSSWTVTYLPATPFEDGTYWAKIDADDIVGNNMGVQTSPSFSIDTTQPTVIDTDNDGESDYTERATPTTDWLDPADNSGGTDFWPVNGQKVNYASLVTNRNSRIIIQIDDPDGGNYSSTPDIDASTVTITKPDTTTYTFGANDTPYPKNIISSGSTAGLYSFNRFTCQIPVPLANDGTDDGIYTVEIIPVDDIGNIGTTITRTFIYDTIVPTITIVNAPTSGNTTTPIEMIINVTDVYGISDEVDAVRFFIAGATFTMVRSAITPSRYSFSFTVNNAGTENYYFTAMDYAGNVSTFPVNADNNPAQRITLTITDTSGPWAVIGNDSGGPPPSRGGEPDSFIRTLINIPTSGLTVNYNYASTPAVDQIPDIYSANNNILQATIEEDAVSAIFQYKLSTATIWIDIPTSHTSTNQVWEAIWDTTSGSIAKGLVYDIRVVATDTNGNTSTPSSVGSPGWVQLKLEDALAPLASIDTSVNDDRINDGGRINGNFIVLVASTPDSGNVDFSTITFQYRAAAGGSWDDITPTLNNSAVDYDPTNETKTNIKFRFDYNDIPIVQQAENIVLDTSLITNVIFICNSDDTYTTVMEKVGNGYEVTISFPPGIYGYKFMIQYSDGTDDTIDDPHQFADGVAVSSITIKPFSAVWDISGLSDGSYHIRAVAKDSRGISDSSPDYITIIIDRTAPTSISITQPTSTDNRLQTNTAYDLYAEVSGGDTDYVFFLFSSDGGNLFNWIVAADTSSVGGWRQSWTPPSLSNDTTYILRAYAVDEAGNLAISSPLSVVLDATDPEIIAFSIDKKTDTEMDLDMGTLYSWAVTTTDPDIDNLTFTTGLGSEFYSWSPGSNITSYSGSGTTADPYKFSGTVRFAITAVIDNQAEIITSTLTDKSGRTDAVSKTVNLKDITPSHATIGQVDGLEVRPGEKVITADRFIQLRGDLDIDDDGVTKWQYRKSGDTTWITWLEDNTPDDGELKVFPEDSPTGITLSDGDYELRILCIDDDNNADPSPEIVTITVDSSQPDIKPASIITLGIFTGILTAIEYDELVDSVQFEYRAYGSTTAWTNFGVDTTTDTAFGNAGNTWSLAMPALPAGKYEVRAISYFAGGPAEADASLTPVAIVEIKRDAVGTRIYLLEPEERVSIALSNPVFNSILGGAEQTFTATLSITSTQTLSNVTARLLLAGSVDRYLTVSGSGGSWTASLDISELISGGTGRIVINATDASGNRLSASQPIGFAASAINPGFITVGRVIFAAAPFAAGLENTSALAILPAAMPVTPQNQSTLITPIGEPWKFLLSEPEAFEVTNTVTITMAYSDNELKGADENKIGIAYWDETNSRWSAEGITGVTRDTIGNTVTFTVSHFSRFSLAVIDSGPAAAFISPVNNGYASSSPLIEIDLDDSFSAIRGVKIEIDGTDQTAMLTAIANRDGIDNDGNGLIDEGTDIVFTTDYEVPLNQVSATAAKYKVRAPLHLSDGQHTIKITVTNEQGISKTRSISFTVDNKLEIKNVHNYPNPFSQINDKETTIKFTMTKVANVTIKIYDFAGDLVATVIEEKEILNSPVEVKWDGVDEESKKYLANGVYFARIEATDGVRTVNDTIKIAILR